MNRLRPRLLAIQTTRPMAYRVKVLGRALFATRADANSTWMLLSGNADSFPSGTTAIAAAANLPTIDAATSATSAAAVAALVMYALTTTATRCLPTAPTPTTTSTTTPSTVSALDSAVATNVAAAAGQKRKARP
jgi:hypothetical protein